MSNEITNNTAAEVSSEFARLAAKAKKDASKLPRVEYFRVDIDKGTGSAEKWHATGYVLHVKVQGVDGLYLAGSVGAYYGMNIKSKYKTEEDAREAGFKMKKTWGRVNVEKAKKAKEPTKKDLANMADADLLAWAKAQREAVAAAA